MLFILLLAFSALFVAGCAAFFSIKGLMVLFAGSQLAVAIMAAALETGKLVAASFLHRHWKDTSVFMRTYLCIAIVILMGITSMGIFGFLTNAYQLHAASVRQYETELTTIDAEKKGVGDQIQQYTERLKTLTDIRADQEKRVQAAGNYKTPREQAYKAITEANTEIAEKEKLLSQLRERQIALEKDALAVHASVNTKTDVGSFKFIAQALNVDIDTAVRYFILALVFVFDPLAVSLVLALNILLEKRTAKKKKETPLATKANIAQDQQSDKIANTSTTTEVTTVTEDKSDFENDAEYVEEEYYDPGVGAMVSVRRARSKSSGPGDSVITS